MNENFQKMKSQKNNEQINSLKHFQQHSRLHFIGQWKTKVHDLFKNWFEMNPSWNHGILSNQNLYAHLDMDAFFCSVALAKDENNHLRDQPVCVAAGKFNSDISSCNYIARSYGISAGMYVNAAKAICPNLNVLGYDLERCEEINKYLYRLLFELCPNSIKIAIEVYSIDEVMIAFDTNDSEIVINYINNVRCELEKNTKCTASCGIGHNIMLARIATTFAKPNGINFIHSENASNIVAQLPFNKIHGVGVSTMMKLRPLLQPYLKNFDFNDDKILCRHVQKLTKNQMQRVFGQKSGENFYNLCRGNDTRLVKRTGDEENQRILGKKIPTSLGCSMNYAVRVSSLEDIWSITKELIEAVCEKLKRINLLCSGLRITLLERHPLHPKETQKYMGRGKCLEFHIPVNFESSLKSSDQKLMLSKVKDILSPLFVLSRLITDEERAIEIGLKNDLDSKNVWTVSINTNSNIVISDIRGMTILAVGLQQNQDHMIGVKRARGVQLSLLSAFSKIDESKQQPLEISDSSPNISGIYENCFEFSILNEMMTQDVNEVFFKKWKNLTLYVSENLNFTAIKALIRLAAFRCSEISNSNEVAGETFESLVEFANGLLPVTIDFT